MGGSVTVTSLSPAHVGWLSWRWQSGFWIVSVVCKATFPLRPGAALAAQQEPIWATDQPYPGWTSRGVYAPADLVPMKPRVDVVLVGSAHAAPGQWTQTVTARLAIGGIDKRIEVWAERQLFPDGRIGESVRFQRMALHYERAAGGPETGNPIGVRPDVKDAFGCVILPGLSPPGQARGAQPIGFGPIASSWSPRRELAAALAGPVAEWNGQSLPAALDPVYFNAAPLDQRLTALRGDETLTLEHLSPEHQHLSLSLPGVAPHAVAWRGSAQQHVTMRADTLWIDADRGVFTIAWRGQIPLDGPAEALSVRVGLEPLDPIPQVADEADSAASTLPLASSRDPRFATMDLSKVTLSFASKGPPSSGAALPFQAAGEAAPASAREAPSQDPARSEARVAVRDPRGATAISFHDRDATETVAGSLAPIKSPGPAWLARDDEPPQTPPPILSYDSVASTRAPSASATPTVASPWAGAPGAAEMPFARPVAPSDPAAPRALADVAKAAAPAPRVVPSEALHLVWFENASLPRLRRTARYEHILSAFDERPLDEELEDPDLADDAASIEDRGEIFDVLARGEPIGDEAVTRLLDDVSQDGRFVQPVALVEGEIALVFDELEELRATCSLAEPSAGVDPACLAMLKLVEDYLRAPGLPGSPAVAEGLTARIRETFAKRDLSRPGYLEEQVTRALLTGRSLQRRSIFGAPHVRVLVHVSAGRPPIPAYLGEEAASQLPATRRVRARILAEVHHALDAHEAHPAALRPIGLALLSRTFRPS